MLSQISKWLRRPSDDQRYWDEALRILQKINPNLVLAKLPWWKRLLVRTLVWFPRRQFTDTWLAKKPNKAELASGVAMPLMGRDKDSRAFEIQVRVLEYAIQLRKAVYRGELRLAAMPDPESEKKKAEPAPQSRRLTPEKGADVTIRSLMAQIRQVSITSDAMSDIEADYWNKLATIAWEAAEYERKERKGDPGPWLRRARQYIDIASTGRPTWTPAQLNLARITAMDGNRDTAIDILDRILGKEMPPQPVPPSTPATRPDESEAIVALIQKMAIERDPSVLADLIRRDYGPISRNTVRKVTGALAGTIDGKFLDDLFRLLSPVPAPLVEKSPT